MRANDWTSPQWRSSAHDWITSRLTELGTPPTGPIEEVRVRPWSVTHRVSTSDGVRWFKANTPACAYEAGLASALASWLPGRVLAPLAADTTRGWLLTADAGPTIRDRIKPGDQLTVWTSMLQTYASMQRALEPRSDAMLALGTPDLRKPADVLASLRSEPGIRDESRPPAPGFADWCAELAADTVPVTLQHDDLTDANVFPSPGGGFVFFDWGDASVGHPFGSLLVALGFAAAVLDLEPMAPELLRLRDAYLEPWTGIASPATLRRSASLAFRVARVSRAAAWRRAVQDAALPVDEDFRTASAYWLSQLDEPALI